VTVHIHYLRPPDREEVFHQALLLDRPEVKVTLARELTFEPPIVIHGEVALETGSEVVWFTFPGTWHDIGRFHTAAGTFRGYYANILTPPTFHPKGEWRTTDLFLDVWLPPGGRPAVLDRDQFDEAVAAGWIDASTRERALAEVESILESEAAGTWPPSVAREWTLERARSCLRERRRQPESG
jgi:predicted RNA-binding protein associated with RNAse of E/G family